MVHSKKTDLVSLYTNKFGCKKVAEAVYTYDKWGDITAIYRSSDSKLIGTYEYDLWGKLISIKEAEEGIDTDDILTKNPIRYRGYYYDNETGFYHLTARYYDPAIRRFINADSTNLLLVATTSLSCKNLFNYSENNPVMNKDNSGAIFDSEGGFMWIFIGYIVEVLVLYIWYKFILTERHEQKGELKRKNIIGRSVKIVRLNYKKVVFNYVHAFEMDEELQKVYKKIINCLLSVMMEIIYFFGYIIVIPVFLDYYLLDEENVWTIVIFFGMLCALVISWLKDRTQIYVRTINNYTECVMIPLEKKPELLGEEIGNKDITRWDWKIILMIVLCFIIMLIVENSMKYKWFRIMVLIVGGAFMIKSFFVGEKKEQKTIPEGIEIYGDVLDSIREEIIDMCDELNIKSLECKITNIDTANSWINDKGVAQVEIGYNFIREIYFFDAKNILLLTIAHELSHIHYYDFKNKRKNLHIQDNLHIQYLQKLQYGLLRQFLKRIPIS